jgi:two-component system response regulator NreC
MRVILADDHRMMRDGLRAVLEKAGVEVVAEAANGREAIAEVRRVQPDIVIMDVGMPELNGIDATRRLAAEMPLVKVIALSMNADRRYVIAMLEAGAVGYLLKNSASEELLVALQAVTRGETYVSPAVAGNIVNPATHGGAPGGATRERPLSAREREVLQLIAEGKSSKEIGVTLGIAVTTVETHRRQLMDKLNLRTIAELTKYAIREGMTSGEPYPDGHPSVTARTQ